MLEKREFKVHDRVTADRGSYVIRRIGTVTRLTKTQVIVQFPGIRVESRFNRETGRSIGTDTWNTVYLSHVTDQDYQDIAWQDLKSLAGRLDKIADEYGRRDAVLQLQIMADKFISHLDQTKDF